MWEESGVACTSAVLVWLELALPLLQRCSASAVSAVMNVSQVMSRKATRHIAMEVLLRGIAGHWSDPGA